MDLLLICRDGSTGSLVSNLLWVMEARKAGVDAAVLFSSEGLAALHTGTFLWPRELAIQDVRWQVADSAKAQGLPVMLTGQARQLDFHTLYDRAKEAGVPMYADPIWTDLLALRGKLASGLTEIERSDMLTMITTSKNVVGSL